MGNHQRIKELEARLNKDSHNSKLFPLFACPERLRYLERQLRTLHQSIL